jgi:hypothetical protein
VVPAWGNHGHLRTHRQSHGHVRLSWVAAASASRFRASCDLGWYCARSQVLLSCSAILHARTVHHHPSAAVQTLEADVCVQAVYQTQWSKNVQASGVLMQDCVLMVEGEASAAAARGWHLYGPAHVACIPTRVF